MFVCYIIQNHKIYIKHCNNFFIYLFLIVFGKNTNVQAIYTALYYKIY